MGILELLTIVFVLLKAFGVIGWSWYLVLTPLIISVSIYIVMLLLWIIAVIVGYKKVNKFNDW